MKVNPFSLLYLCLDMAFVVFPFNGNHFQMEIPSKYGSNHLPFFSCDAITMIS